MGAVGAVGVVGAVGTIGATGRAAVMSISRRSWLCVVIDACSFKGQLRLLIVWPCLWHAEHVEGCLICSSPIERIRPVRAILTGPICYLRACSGSRSGRETLLRSQYQCSWKSIGVSPPVSFFISHICAQGNPIARVKLPVQGFRGRETNSRCRCTSRKAYQVTTPKQPWYSFLSILRGARSCCILVRVNTAII